MLKGNKTDSLNFEIRDLRGLEHETKEKQICD